MDPLYACTAVVEGVCASWIAISLPTADPSLWTHNAQLGFAAVFGLFSCGAAIGYMFKLTRM